MNKISFFPAAIAFCVAVLLFSAGNASAAWMTPAAVADHSGTEDAPYTADKIIDGISGPGGTRNMAVFTDDTDPVSDPITGHLVLDLGEKCIANAVKIWARNDSTESLFPKNVDVFYYADDDWSNNAVADDIEGDDDITAIWSGTLDDLVYGEDQTIDFASPVAARYIGIRVNSSYGWDSFQIGEVAVDASPVPEPGIAAFLLCGAFAVMMIIRGKR